jgi:outer membrane protein
MMRFFVAAMAVYLLGTPLAAQGDPVARQALPAQLTLDEAIAIALRNNASYLLRLNDPEVNEAARRNAFSRLLPIPSASFSTGAGPSRNISPVGTTSSSSSNTSFNFGLSMNIWDGGATLNQYRQSKMQIEGGTLNIAAQEISLRASVTTQYYQTQQSERAVALERRLLAARRDELKDTELKFAEALVDVLGMERAKQNVRQYENNVLNAEDTEKKAKLALLGAMGIEAETSFTLTTPLPTLPASVNLNADSLVQLALERNPQVRLQQINLEQTRMNTRITRNSRYMPNVRLTANFGRGISESGYSGLFDPSAKNTSMSGNFGFSFSFNPLIDIPNTSLRMKSAGASLHDATISMNELKLNITRQVKVAVIDLASAYRQLAFAESAKVNAQLQLEVANDALGAGTTNYFNYQVVVDAQAAAERDVLNQQLNVLRLRIALDQLLGTRPGS